ncbi:MAG TPA: translocation/assembly module TamB domain-containing protein [Saprospiraceae bacterium]|nr:translocation/assembly module TamB domain-containing protein [Saprospiraceae bacterium]HNT21129.1 translocation/assembly module TamB domain-containing protein [Saprospiraceae bacterium]
MSIPEKYKATFKGKIFRGLLTLVVGCILLILFLALVIQAPPVQNWARTKAEVYLSGKLGQAVTIDRFSLEWFNRFMVSGVHVSDARQDTLVHIDRFAVDLNMAITSLLRKDFRFKGAFLEGLTLKDLQYEGDSLSSLEQALRKLNLKSGGKKSGGGGISLDLESLALRRIHFIQDSPNSTSDIYLDDAAINVDLLDLKNKRFEIDRIVLTRPSISLSSKGPKTKSKAFKWIEDSLLTVKIRELSIRDGRFDRYDIKPVVSWQAVTNHLQDISLEVESLSLSQGRLEGTLGKLTALNPQQMGIRNLSAGSIVVDYQTIQLNGLDLQTRDSRLKDSIQLHFKGFENFARFEDEVKWKMVLNGSSLSVSELLEWLPSLKKNRFLQANSAKKLEMDGLLTGSINDLKGSKVVLKIGNTLSLNGDFDLNNVTIPGESFLSLRLKNLQTDMASLRQLLPANEKLANFDKLGKLRFRGNFDGSLADFVAYGVLQTDIGSSRMDMRLNTRKGAEVASYSGEIDLIDFDLGKWAENEELGKTSLKAKITDGKGLTAATAEATLEAVVSQLDFKKYAYKDITFDGHLNQKLLDGKLILRDANADLAFIGKIDFTNTQPAYNFTAEISQLDLYRLNISKKPLAFSGNTEISMIGRNFDELIGKVDLDQVIIQVDSVPVLLQNMEVDADRSADGTRGITVHSDWIDGELRGNYLIKNIWPALNQQLKNQFPDFLKSLPIQEALKQNPDSVISCSYDFTLDVKDLRGLSRILKQDMEASQPFRLKGSVHSAQKYMVANWNIVDFRWKDFKVFNAIGRLEAKGAVAYTTSLIDSIYSGNFRIPQLVLTADLSYNLLNFSIRTPEVSKLLNNVSLNGAIRLIDSSWHLSLAPSNLSFMDKNWSILPNNEIVYRPGYLRTQNLRFEHGTERIEIVSRDNKGLRVQFTDFDINWVNSFNPVKAWDAGGRLDLNAEIADVFTFRGVRLSGRVDSFYINDTYFGLLDLNLYNVNTNQPFNLSVALLDGSRQLMGEGFFDPSGKNSNGVKNNYQFKVLFKDFPLKLFEFMIDDIVDQTRGNIVGTFEINKVGGKPEFKGRVNIGDGSLKINYLGTSFQIGNQPVTITNNLIDASGVSLRDELGNTGTIQGGIEHDRFNRFRLNAGIRSNRFLVLKTTKVQNPDYYGTVVGNVNARFTGPFNRIDIDVQGTTARPTVLYIPISQTTEITSERLVKFRPVQASTASETQEPRVVAANGLSVSIDLTVNDDAEISLIFDEKRGDILKGRGNGDLQMRFERNGDIAMFGNYEVEQGEYLFTLLGVVNKPFVIRQGGTIRWDGSPTDADINLDADYKGLTSSLINLLPEYENAIESAELRTQSAVDLSMHLFGKLFKPEISFGLDIPNLTGNLRNIVDNKLNLLKSDQNALNQQVLGLMVWGSFLPPNQLVASSGVIGSTINNLSQFISNQLSILVENALKELVADNAVISGFDFDVNYYNNNNAIDINNLSVFDEVAISLGPRFFEDRLSVGVGANFINSTLFNRLITPHFEVEYALTRDRRLKIRAYAKKDDINQGQLRDRIGGGLSWRKEFDSIREFKQKLKDDLNQRGPASDL